MNKILIIDDDYDLCNLMKQCVLHEGFIPLIANDKKSAVSILTGSGSQLALIILDIMLPDGSGLELLSHIRSSLECPVIMATAMNSLEDKVIGLRMGADDYLTKPFSLKELEARITAQTRRYFHSVSDNRKQKDVLLFHTIEIDSSTRIVHLNDNELALTGREFDILFLLASYPGSVFTKKQIYEQIWHEEYLYDDNSLMALICKIRKKLEVYQSDFEYIETVRGIGYRFNKGA